MGTYVKNGTPVEGPSLCQSCEHAMVVKGFRVSQEIVMCEANYPVLRVTFPVRDCSRYLDRNREVLYEMKKIAHVLKNAQPGRTPGFTAAPYVEATGREVELVLDEENELDSIKWPRR